MRCIVAIAAVSIGCGWYPELPATVPSSGAAASEVPAPAVMAPLLPDSPPAPPPPPPPPHESPPPSPVIEAPATPEAALLQLAGFAEQVCDCAASHDRGCAHRAMVDLAGWMNVASEQFTALGATADGMRALTRTVTRVRQCAAEAMQPTAPAP